MSLERYKKELDYLSDLHTCLISGVDITERINPFTTMSIELGYKKVPKVCTKEERLVLTGNLKNKKGNHVLSISYIMR